MNVRFQILPELELIVETIEGELSIEDLFEKTNKLFSHPDFRKEYVGVMDLRKAEASITRPEMYAYAEFLNTNENLKHSRWAAVVTDPLLAALSDLVKMRVVESIAIGVFSSVGEAAKYLEKPEILDYLEPD